MMTKTILVILVSRRRESAVSVQQVLTDFGCIIKTRLGIHDGVLDRCSDSGLIVLEVVGEDRQKAELSDRLQAIPGISAKRVELSAE